MGKKIYLMSKVYTQKCIEEITQMLREGKERKEILPIITQTYPMSLKTFNNRLKDAREIVLKEIQLKEKVREDTLPEAYRSEILEGIATESEIDLVLSKIVMGECRVEEWIKGELVIKEVSPTDIVAAADKLYKRKGSYAPTKVAPTDKDGNDLPQQPSFVTIDVSILPTEILEQIIQIQKIKLLTSNLKYSFKKFF